MQWGVLEVAVLKFTIREDFTEELAKKLSAGASRVEEDLANEVKKDTEKFVPFRNGVLAKGTRVYGGKIVYPGPYAHYLYRGKVMVYEGPPYLRRREDGKMVLSHFGQRKVPIEKPLDIKRASHKDAQSHWFEASKAQNLEKWETLAGRMMKREIKK